MKILIGCPTYERYDYCVDKWIKRVKEIIEFSKNNHIDYLLVDNSKTDEFLNKLRKNNVNVVKSAYSENVRERIVISRNLLREKVLKEKYDYFFSLEQDIIPEIDILEKLIGQGKKIISAYYSKPFELIVQDKETEEIKKIKIEAPIIYLQEGEKVRRANPNEILNKGLIRVGAFGVGCVMINREVLEKIKFRYEKEKVAFDDLLFCADAKKHGYELFLDSNIMVMHLHRPWDDIHKI